MTKRMLLATSMTAGLLLTGCGNKDEHSFKTDEGGEVKVATNGDSEAAVITTTAPDGSQSRIETGGSWPAALAAIAPAYPGAKLSTTMSGNQDGSDGAMAAFDTSDPPAKVIEFYKTRSAAAGLTGAMNMESGETRMFTAADDKTGRTLSVQASFQDGKTSAIVTGSTKKP